MNNVSFPVVLLALGFLASCDKPQNHPSPIIEIPGASPENTDEVANLESQFEKITDGMTLAEVEAIIGPGEQLPSPSFTVEGKEDAIGYRWTDGDYAILLDFHEGRVVSRAEQNPDPAKFFD